MSIPTLKQQLKNARKNTENWDTLNKQRDKIEEMIESTTVLKLDTSELKKRKLEIDHLLDELEDLEAESIATIQQQLINEVLKENPSETSRYEAINNAQTQNAQKIEEVNEVLLSLSQVHSLLMLALDERSLIKKRGILRYIIGKNPNFIISKCLDTANELSEDAIKTMSRHSGYEAIISMLKVFQKECEEKWSFKKIDTVFAKTLSDLTAVTDALKEKLQQLKQQKAQNEQTLEEWLAKW